jgi:hypothetical protein
VAGGQLRGLLDHRLAQQVIEIEEPAFRQRAKIAAV